MQINRLSSYRTVSRGKPVLTPLFAIAIALAFTARVSAQLADNADDGRTRLLNIVPADAAETSAAAAIADLAAQAELEAEAVSAADNAAVEQAEPESKAETAADVAAAAQAVESEPSKATDPSGAAAAAAEVVVETATDVAVAKVEPVEHNPLLAALSNVHSPAELYENLVAAGYEVAVVHIGQTNSKFLVKKPSASTGVLLLVDGRNGKVLSHQATGTTGDAHSNGRPAHGYGPAYNGYYQTGVDYNARGGYGYNPPASYGYTWQYGGY